MYTEYVEIPKLSNLYVKKRRVVLRLDLDVGDEDLNVGNLRLRSSLETLNYLISEEAKIVVLGHRGRPEGRVVDGLSLKPLALVLSELTGKEVIFEDLPAGRQAGGDIVLKENLRFDPGEEANSPEYAKKLAELGEIYINEAFGVSHREHASIVGIAKLIPGGIGFHLRAELNNLGKIIHEPKRPLIYVLSGVKEDKISYIKAFEEHADKILVGGRLPDFLGDKALESVRLQKGKVIIGNLIMDKEDITLNTIEVFEKELMGASTIVLAGPLGRYEDAGHRQGTERIFKAITSSSAFKVAGGGDTEAAISALGMENNFDWISVGGGAMLEYLSKKTLPGIEVLKR